MRLTLLLICMPSVAAAWEFSIDPLCTLRHQSDTASVEITHDPSLPEYRMHLSLTAVPWDNSPTFGIAFHGPRPLTIGTERHKINDQTLSVADTGFGNVLNGLQFNQLAIAFTATQSVQLSLEGAGPEVAKFRECALQAPATS